MAPSLCRLCAGAIALHALYSPSITTTSLLAGAAVMGATFAIPYQVLPLSPASCTILLCLPVPKILPACLSLSAAPCRSPFCLSTHPPARHAMPRPPARLQHYVKTNGGLKVGEAIKSYFGAVPDHLK